MNTKVRMNVVATIMRVVLGVIFMAHGLGKLQMGLSNTSGWFESIGLPGALAYIVAFLELIGGIALIAGLLTRAFSISYIAIMIGAIITVKLPAGLIGTPEAPGYELDLALMALALYFAFATYTGYGLDNWIFRKDEEQQQ